MSSRLPSRSATFYCDPRAREIRSGRPRSIVWLRTNVRCSDVGMNITPLRDAVRSNARPLPPCPSAMALTNWRHSWASRAVRHPWNTNSLSPRFSSSTSTLLQLFLSSVPPKTFRGLKYLGVCRRRGDGGPLALPHPWMSSPLRICALVESADGCRRRSEGVSVLFGCVGLVVVRGRRDA